MPGPEAYRSRSSTFKLWGAVSIPAPESTTATTYAIGNLTTPDRVQNVVLNTNGLLVVGYRALWQNTVTANAKAAIFIGANQLKMDTNAGGAAAVQEATGNSTINIDAGLNSHGGGIGSSTNSNNAGTSNTDVTTGQVVGYFGSLGAMSGGLCYIFAAAGTYDISIQFKNVAAGTLTVKNRHLWVATIG